MTFTRYIEVPVHLTVTSGILHASLIACFGNLPKMLAWMPSCVWWSIVLARCKHRNTVIWLILLLNYWFLASHRACHLSLLLVDKRYMRFMPLFLGNNPTALACSLKLIYFSAQPSMSLAQHLLGFDPPSSVTPVETVGGVSIPPIHNTIS